MPNKNFAIDKVKVLKGAVKPAKKIKSDRVHKEKLTRRPVKNLVSVGNLLSAKYSKSKLTEGKELSKAKFVREGQLFERKFHAFAREHIHTEPSSYRSSVTFNIRFTSIWRKANVRPVTTLCEIDGLWMPKRDYRYLNPPCIIYECKRSNTPTAWGQLRCDYFPVINHLHPTRPTALVQVVSKYNKAVPHSLSHYRTPKRIVFIKTYADIVFDPEILHYLVFDSRIPPTHLTDKELVPPTAIPVEAVSGVPPAEEVEAALKAFFATTRRYTPNTTKVYRDHPTVGMLERMKKFWWHRFNPKVQAAIKSGKTHIQHPLTGKLTPIHSGTEPIYRFYNRNGEPQILNSPIKEI